MSFLIGGVYGDLKEYGGNVAQCVCCLMCSGPVLILVGIILFASSFNDNRLQMINERNGFVADWNSGLGAEGANSAFHGMTDLSIVFSVARSTVGNEVVKTMGSTAPEPVGDKSQRDEESFTEVTEPWYYKTDQPFKYSTSFVCALRMLPLQQLQ